MDQSTPLSIDDAMAPAIESMLRMREERESGDESTRPICPTSNQRTSRSVEDSYALGREIGRGHYGVVRTCRHKASGATLACKTIQKSSILKAQDAQELCSEVLGMLKMQQQGARPGCAVHLHDVLEDEAAFHLVMDYCGGGDLFDHIARHKRLCEKETAQIVCQLALALQSLHEAGMVHRDLKPENVLVQEAPTERGGSCRVKLADFGLCVHVGPGQRARGVAGSPFYMAPEVILGRDYGAEVDIWALGVIMYTCLAGCLPFYGRSHDAVFASVCRTTVDFAKKPWPLVSFDAKSLICLMLDRDPKRRIRLSDILLHPWVRRHCPEHPPLERHLPPGSASTSIFAKAFKVLSQVPRSGQPGGPVSSASAGLTQNGEPTPAICRAARTVGGAGHQQMYTPAAVSNQPLNPDSSNSCTESSSTQASTFASAASSSSSSSSSASSMGQEHKEEALSVHPSHLPRNKVPAGSRKGFSAPLSKPCPRG